MALTAGGRENNRTKDRAFHHIIDGKYFICFWVRSHTSVSVGLCVFVCDEGGDVSKALPINAQFNSGLQKCPRVTKSERREGLT